MNDNLPDSHASIQYNDSDYPSRDHGRFPENMDETTELQGVAHDVERYVQLAGETDGPIVEIGCGTGRVCIPLARAGYHVHAVDVSGGMLELLRKKLTREPAELVERITIEQTDATVMALTRRDFALGIIPFNTLQCIPSFDAQCEVLVRLGEHIRPGGQLVIDLMNPHRLNLAGDPAPKLFFTRINEWTGRPYSRFAMVGPMDAEQRQRLYGWYDEIQEDGTVKRLDYAIVWRPIFRYEIQLMLERAGFDIDVIEGGHRGEEFNASSHKMFVRAVRRN